MTLSVLVAVIGAGATSLSGLSAAYVGYRLALRKASGRVSTTDADSLWKEAGAIRREMREELSRKDERIAHLEMENRFLTARVGELENELHLRLQAMLKVAGGTVPPPPGAGDR